MYLNKPGDNPDIAREASSGGTQLRGESGDLETSARTPFSDAMGSSTATWSFLPLQPHPLDFNQEAAKVQQKNPGDLEKESSVSCWSCPLL